MATVQAINQNGHFVTSITTPSITTTSANALSALACYTSTSNSGGTLSDSKTNTWTEVPTDSPQVTSSGHCAIRVYNAKNISGGASHTFTWTLSSADFPSMIVVESSGRDTTAPLNAHGGYAESGTGTSHSGATVTASASDDVLLMNCDDSGGAEVFTATSPFSIPTNGTNGDGTQYNVSHTQNDDNVSSGSITPQWTTSRAIVSAGLTITLKAASGGGFVPAWGVRATHGVIGAGVH